MSHDLYISGRPNVTDWPKAGGSIPAMVDVYIFRSIAHGRQPSWMLLVLVAAFHRSVWLSNIARSSAVPSPSLSGCASSRLISRCVYNSESLLALSMQASRPVMGGFELGAMTSRFQHEEQGGRKGHEPLNSSQGACVYNSNVCRYEIIESMKVLVFR